MEAQHLKSFNVDQKGKNRLRFASSKQRSKKLSADVYRSYKRRFGVTSAADREESVHRPKRRRENEEESNHENEQFSSTFAEELELANDRNGSALFAEFYRDVWPLVRSVPEILHHSSILIDELLSYVLSPESSPGEKTPAFSQHSSQQCAFVPNHATTDVLHLLAVLAKDLQHEIHSFVYSKILPRLVRDLLNPPAPPADSGKQAIPVDVLIVETAFRTLSYIFQHDAETLVAESNEEDEEPCLEGLRAFYGATLGHKREVVRRLAAETFAPLIRRMKTDSARKKHLRRVIRALIKREPGIPSHALKRAKCDAIDGVATLLFEIAKGVPGRLHSKGSQIVRCVMDSIVAHQQDITEYMVLLSSTFMGKVYDHVYDGALVDLEDIVNEMQHFMTRILEKHRKYKEQTNDFFLSCSVNLLIDFLHFRNSAFFPIKSGDDIAPGTIERLDCFTAIVDDLTIADDFTSMSISSAAAVFKLFFAVWDMASKVMCDQSFFTLRFAKLIEQSESRNHDQSSRSLIPAIVNIYVEACTDPGAVRAAFPSIMLSVAGLSISDPDLVTAMLFSLTSKSFSKAPAVDDLFPVVSEDSGLTCDKEVCLTLLEHCVRVTLQGKDIDRTNLADLSFCSRLLPFLCSIAKSTKAEKRTGTWIIQNLDCLEASDADEELHSCRIVTVALLIQSFSRVASVASERSDVSWLNEALLRCKSIAWDLVLACPESLWATQAMSSLCNLLRKHDIYLCDDSNTAFDLLVHNLRKPSHFLRLYTLRILDFFPNRPYVTNHHDVVLFDDLDEDVSTVPLSGTTQSTLSGLCDLIDTLLSIESAPIGIGSERKVAALLTRIELIGKSGKLPVVYAEALANHMIGLFHLKFSPLWTVASRVLIGLSNTYHDILCDVVCQALEDVMRVDPADTQREAAKNVDLGAIAHQEFCLAWESSSGRDSSLFQDQTNTSCEEGYLSPFLCTDRETVCQEVMKVLQSVPEITAKHSRRIVPMFIDFLKTHYYCFYDNSPDSRELSLEHWSNGQSCGAKEVLSSRCLQSRLLAFLNVFAAVNGTQQLYMRSDLIAIFNVFISHQDAEVAGTSLKCLVNFKFSFVPEYSEKLQHLLRKGGLRDALLNFNLSKDSETIHPEHRHLVLPVIQRILFGRLSSSSMKGVKSKDSPAAIRKAIVSSVSQLDDIELFPLVYLMIRNYLPSSFELHWDLVIDPLYQQDVLDFTRMDHDLNFAEVQIQRHEGFLNLLSALVSQLGRNFIRYIPTMMAILNGIMKSPVIPQSAESDQIIESEIAVTDDSIVGRSHRLRSIKALAFRCTASLLDKHADSIDYTPYSDGLWRGISIAVKTLPDIVRKSNSAPSILCLLLVLSEHDCFRRILYSHKEIVESIILCIGPTSDDKALDSALDFLLNLLPNDSSPSNCSNHDLIDCHLLLLLRQFQLRFGEVLDAKFQDFTSSTMKTSKTVSKELNVLRKVADLTLDGFISKTSSQQDTQTEVYSMLSKLLVQFLGHPRTNEGDKLNVLRILSALIPKVDTDSALSQYFSLSKLLSPEHWCRLSPTTRCEIGEAMRNIARRNKLNCAIDRVTRLLQDMFALNSKRVDELDYDRVIPALASLYDSNHSSAWKSLLCSSTDDRTLVSPGYEPHFLTPLAYVCLALLQQGDAVVSRSAFKALRHLIASSSQGDCEVDHDYSKAWAKFVETSVVPGARRALRSSNEQVRRHSLSLIADIARVYASNSSPNLHGDLSVLICLENSDLDFFTNVLHVQSHRRCRALQRLRKRLSEIEINGEQFSVNSLSNVLLPLVTFPIYECKSNLEESLVQESIATAGALGRHLSWSKYHALLWTALNQLERHPNQERLIIGMICALLDSFHFDLIDTANADHHETAVWRALENRVIPKVEGLVVLETRDRTGKTNRTIRPNVLLALLKLYKKFPEEYFEKKLPRLLAIVCDALKNRDSNVRELARKALAAMVVEVGPKWLSEVIRSLSVVLTEGYQLHVRSATLHRIVSELSNVYSPRRDNLVVSVPDFDRCIPSMMDLILQDMFGVASERREVDGAQKKLVKEAAGSKYLDLLELIGRLLLFKPSEILDASASAVGSSVHHVVRPFIEKLQDESITSKSVQMIKESLRRIVTGLVCNESADTYELLQFVHATISPMLKRHGEQDPLVSGDQHPVSDKCSIVIWHPRSAAAPKNAKDALDRKLLDQASLAAVQDGAQAPKLTGSSRHLIRRRLSEMNSFVLTCVVEFGLNLLHATLKSKRFPSNDSDGRLSPFLTLLTTCVCESWDNAVTGLAMRCVGLLLKKGVEPSPYILNPLGSRIVDILSRGEAIVGTNPEMLQTCLVALSTLLSLKGSQRCDPLNNEMGLKNQVLTLSDEQMTILLSILKESILTCNDSNAAIGILKVLLSRHFVSPELYDLMEELLDASVRSHRENFRDQCGNVFISFLVEYPLSERRFEQHLRQALLNMNYEHKEGRMSAIRLIHTVIDRLPLEVIDKEVQLMFLPLTIQLVNDDSKECRELVAKCIKRLICRISASVAGNVYEYVLRWHRGDNGALRRASLQLFGIIAEGKHDMVSQTCTLSEILACLQSSLDSPDADWEHHYFALVSLEKVMDLNPTKCSERTEIWSGVVKELSHSHLWVKTIASRILCKKLESHDPTSISRLTFDLCFIVGRTGSLYDIASALCNHLNEEESNFSTELSELAIKSLSWVSRAMHSNPDLCYSNGEHEGKQPVKWLLTRLSNIARRKGTQRRQAVFKCFAALSHGVGGEMISPFLDVMIEPMHRSMIEAAGAKDHLGTEKFSAEADLAKEVLTFLEEKFPDEFLPAFTQVKIKSRVKREQRKDDLAVERVVDPSVAAKKKIVKQITEKERRKRKVGSHRSNRGATAKRQHL